MPEYSSIKAFVNAVKTRRTKPTKVLDALFSSPAGYQGTPLLQSLRHAHALDDLPQWAKDELVKPGQSDPELALSAAELAHINSWPDDEKEKVRAAIVAAVDGARNITFLWELHDGALSVTQVDGLAGTGAITARFLSPRANIRKGGTTYGEVHVDIVKQP